MLFFLIAVYDLREHRIPNNLLLLIISIRTFELLAKFDVTFIMTSLILGVLLFCIGLVFFILRAMSPGDVKLLFVVGFATATVGSAVNLLYWILIAGGIVSIFVIFFNRANAYKKQPISSTLTFAFNRVWHRVILYHAPRANLSVPPGLKSRYGDKLVMPFAPSIVIGMAMFYYFN
ncbi:hypothetical protein BCT04_13475 [Vibrio breoganii]|uniref:prepilin peptidase n=1 Tax=Vibrio breoganii TaxID=553239 RepID=UPI000C85742F|nr:hypothetical protein BCT59_07095 [Vibrio breoganii]PMO64828.1 hypothetical protein BCT04_13475 [Vibrio breoganii]